MIYFPCSCSCYLVSWPVKRGLLSLSSLSVYTNDCLDFMTVASSSSSGALAVIILNMTLNLLFLLFRRTFWWRLCVICACVDARLLLVISFVDCWHSCKLTRVKCACSANDSSSSNSFLMYFSVYPVCLVPLLLLLLSPLHRCTGHFLSMAAAKHRRRRRCCELQPP